MQMTLPSLSSQQPNEGEKQIHTLTRAEAKSAILAAWREYHDENPAPPWRSIKDFIREVQEGSVHLDPGAIQTLGGIPCARSMFRWLKRADQESLEGLDGHYGNRKGAGLIDSQPRLQHFLLAHVSDYPEMAAPHILTAMETHFKDAVAKGEVKLPAVRTLRAWLANWKRQHRADYEAMRDPTGYHNKYLPSFGNMREALTEPNEIWEMDGTAADVMLAEGRHCIIGVFDGYTGRMKFLVSKTNKGSAVKSLLRRTILAWGVPKTLRTDNGSDYCSFDVELALSRLKIEHKKCKPRSGWEKPFIERGFRTLQHGMMVYLPGYCGHNVAEAKRIRERAIRGLFKKRDNGTEPEPADFGTMTRDQLQEFLDWWTEKVHLIEPSTGLKGPDGRPVSPFHVYAAWDGKIKKIEGDAERTLDVLLSRLPKGRPSRIIGKNGLEIDGGVYIAGTLGPVGTEVWPLVDSSDLGRAWVFLDAEYKRFLCIAKCLERAGVSDEEVAAERRAIAIEARKTERERQKEFKKGVDWAQEREGDPALFEKIRAMKTERAAKLVMMPKQTVEYSTPALEAACEAIAAMDYAEPAPPAEDLAKETALIAAREQARQNKPEDSDKRYERIYWAEAAGEFVSQEDAVWARRYETTRPAGKALKQLLDLDRAQRSALRIDRGKE